ncbi:NAD-dependent epimerase/dehydratase family protein [Thermosynechococcus sp. PP45]|uniref:NAD-dependent epimerase/dehydratase family protein n=1 Tax=unclassified Thermosynechococcus TaxID=2622553 RepID=UPI00267222A2|nr:MULTISPECIES: NAD-dependent epimerase/dehydratase family protein [unclassified Thermosynechococcus]WKT80097.1 NAD-dependent epimerase/dehydratase family protein [Thermosynechococcus sp. PP45]WNC23707.1 NAD-dependent epimerase/dehydratase family protein [Thermosynechococcus sp. PP551]WNC26283.1 NAD-dependent epimerase/dehydratase family protein [Thermosynechococcus sp. PP555]
MTIAVTGASGFVGRAVLTELSRRGIHAVVTSRSGTIKSPIGEHHVVPMDIHIVEDAYNHLGKPDTVIHLAWQGLPNYSSLHHFETELPAQYRFLKSLIEAGTKKVIVTGTCFEYGLQSGMLSEDLPTSPCTPYGFAKDALRQKLEFLKSERTFSLVWARLFYLYGEGQAESSLYAQLRSAVYQEATVFNMSGGEQLRDYLPVEKAAEYLVALALSSQDVGVVNVCSGQPISVRRLVEEWLRHNNWQIRLNLGYYPYPAYEPLAFWGDRRKLDSVLKGVS